MSTEAPPGENPQQSGSNGADPRFGEVPPDLAALDGDVDDGKEKLPTLREVGKVLPIGYRDQSGRLHREFETVDWGWDLEEEIGEIAELEPEMSTFVYVSEIVGRGVARLGQIDFTKLKRSQRRLVVSNVYLDDVVQIYTWIRIGALGSQLRLEEFDCEKCPQSIDYVGDLHSLEVKVHDAEHAPRARVELPRPFAYAGDERTAVEVGPMRWSFMETDDPAVFTNPARKRRAIIEAGVVGIEGAPPGPVRFSREHLRAIGPLGVRKLVTAIDQVGGGVVMQIEGACPRCKHAFRRDINWQYSDFFGRSSQ